MSTFSGVPASPLPKSPNVVGSTKMHIYLDVSSYPYRCQRSRSRYSGAHPLPPPESRHRSSESRKRSPWQSCCPEYVPDISWETTMANLAIAENKVLIVQLGGLTPLIRQMQSANVEVQCNAVGCITNLATHEENKAKIARSGALGPLTRLAKSKDMRVQRNATGALLNMTHSGECSLTNFHLFAVTDILQTRTGSSLSTLAPFLSWSSFSHLKTSTCNTTARLLSATSPSTRTTERSSRQMRLAWFSPWSS